MAIGYEIELLKKGYSEEQLKTMHAILNQQIHSDRDNWGPCCPDCPFFGQATKACDLWCLKPLPFKPANPPSK